MLSGLTGQPTNVKLVYFFVNCTVLVYWIVYALYMSNYLAFLLPDQENDRWSSALYWRLALTACAFLPIWTLERVMYGNLIYWRYWLHFWVSLVVGCYMGYMMAWILVDLDNCKNLDYCNGHNLNESDTAFQILFYGHIYLTVSIGVYLLFTIWLKNRIEYKSLLDSYERYGSGSVQPGGGSSFTMAKIAARVEGDDYDYPRRRRKVTPSHEELTKGFIMDMIHTGHLDPEIEEKYYDIISEHVEDYSTSKGSLRKRNGHKNKSKKKKERKEKDEERASSQFNRRWRDIDASSLKVD